MSDAPPSYVVMNFWPNFPSEHCPMSYNHTMVQPSHDFKFFYTNVILLFLWVCALLRFVLIS